MTDRPIAEFPPPTLPTPPSKPVVPTLPTLPPQPRAAPATSTAAARFVAQPAFMPEPRVTRKRRRRWPTLLMLLIILAAAGGTVYGLVLRDESPSDETAGSTELPDLEFTRPVLTSARWVEHGSRLMIQGAGEFVTEETRVDGSADYVRSVARFVASQTTAGVAQHVTVVFTPDHSYVASNISGAPWTRRTSDAESGMGMENPEYLAMYADLVTDDLRRHATNVSTTSSVEAGVSLTTFTFDADASDLAGFGLASSTRELPFIARVTIVIDATTGLVMHQLLDFDEADLRSALSQDLTSLPLTSSVDIVALDGPVDVRVPTDYVDDETSPCVVDKRTLEVAMQAWYAQFGSDTVVTEEQLVSDGILRMESDTYDIVEGLIIPVAGGACA